MKKEIEKGLKMYRKVGYKNLKKQFKDDSRRDDILRFYEKRHTELAEATDYGEKNYKLHFMSHILTVITCYETLLHFGYTKEEACLRIRKIQEPMGKIARRMYNFFDWLPFGYPIIRWSLMKDMTGELGKNFRAEFPIDDKTGFAYIVRKCIYVDTMNEHGYPELVRVCCDNDIMCFSGMHRHVKWTRKCNVGDVEGIHCYDVFQKTKRIS